MKRMRYLRISVTEQCNLSCFFCHHEGSLEDGYLLSNDDIVFICSLAKKMGFLKFKLTGGEPTLRKDICELIRKLSDLNLADLSMITNGSTLESLAMLLWDSGLRRLNVTLNTLDENKHRRINERGYIPIERIISGIGVALGVGFADMKINFIYIDESSNKDLDDVLDFVARHSLTLVLLPVLSMKHNEIVPCLSDLYAIIKNYGIISERYEHDMEGIQRTSLVLENGAKILLRNAELADYKPFVFCERCEENTSCKEGIFPLRLSARGTLIPCMATLRNRIAIRAAIERRDESTIIDAISNILSWQANVNSN
jgi:cyclic pyranopterin phosphate synthase